MKHTEAKDHDALVFEFRFGEPTGTQERGENYRSGSLLLREKVKRKSRRGCLRSEGGLYGAKGRTMSS